MSLRLIARNTARTMRAGLAIQMVAISTVALAVGLLLMLLTLVSTTDQMTERWAEHARVVAFFAPDTPTDQQQIAHLTVATWPEIREVKLIDQATALAELRATLGESAQTLTLDLQPDLIPASLEVALNTEHQSVEAIQAVATRLRALGAATIESVDYGHDLVARINGIARALHISGLLIGAVVAFAMIFIISNTVRMTLHSRRDELEIMQLVGATPGFIRAPCYIEGTLHGLLGAGLALMVLWSAHRWIFGGVTELRFGGLQITLVAPPGLTLLWVTLGAGAVGLAASHLASNHYLRGRV